MALKTLEKAFCIIIREMQIKTIEIHHFLPIWLTKIQSLIIYYVGETINKQAPPYIAGGNLKSTHMKGNMRIFSEIA